jgi:hypothetical protein
MNYFSFYRKATVLKKTFSILTLLALLAGGLTGLVYTSTAYANNGINTYAVPNTGTLVPGQTMDVHMTVALDPTDTNPVTSPSCLVNGVEVKDTFTTIDPAGHFRFTYTVGEDDTSRAAGQVPINCTLHQTGEVTVTAFDDSNTVAIDTSDSSALSISSVSISPSSGTLHEGDSVVVSYQEASNAADLSVSGLCHVNAVDVTSSFSNEGNGLYTFDYTVGAEDGERPAGHIPVSCTFSNSTGSVTATGWTDSNTVAIDTNNDGSIDNGTSTLGFTVVANPSSGTLDIGDTLQVNIQDPLPSADVVIGSAGCRVNNEDVSASYSYQGNGLYRVTYTVASGDDSQAAGEVPFDCTLQNHTGSVHLVDFTDSNTVAINATSSGSGGTDVNISQVSANPSSGTLGVGQTLEVTLQESHGLEGLTLGACTVNGDDVTGSLQSYPSGTYRVTYRVSYGDTERAAGQVPINCTLTASDGGSDTVTAFTDSNTVAISTDLSAGSDGVITYADPNEGTLMVGDSMDVHMEIGLDPSDSNPVTSPSCLVNGVNVAGSFQNLTVGSAGHFKVTYTVGSDDSNRAEGQIPISCTLQQTGSVTITAFDDANTLAVDSSTTTGGTGTTTDPTDDPEYAIPPEITGVSISPSSGTLVASSTSTTTSTAVITLTANKTQLIMGDTCNVNDVDVRSSFQNLGGGLYRVTYTASSTHSDRTAGNIPILCTLRKATIASSTTATAFTDGNTLAIDINGDGIFATSTGTSTGNGGNGTTTATSTDTGGNGTTTVELGPTSGVEPISMVESTATAGGGYEEGWVWIFRITVPEDETNLQMKFGNWTAVSGTSTIAAANNMRISSQQASSTSPVTITAANSYSSPALVLTGDLDSGTAGRQIEIKVEMQVPAGTPDGSYTTTYGIKSF